MEQSAVYDPAGYVTSTVIAIDAAGAAARVAADRPMPVAAFTRQPPAALAGTTGTAIVGPFAPELGRPIWLTLSGSWTGTATLRRSTDGGATKLPATIGGQMLTYTAAINEAVAEESEAGATWWLDAVLTAGALTYRVAQ